VSTSTFDLATARMRDLSPESLLALDLAASRLRGVNFAALLGQVCSSAWRPNPRLPDGALLRVALDLLLAPSQPLHIVFAGEAPDLVFVEVERPLGTSVQAGSWSTDERGHKVLTLPADPPQDPAWLLERVPEAVADQALRNVEHQDAAPRVIGTAEWEAGRALARSFRRSYKAHGSYRDGMDEGERRDWYFQANYPEIEGSDSLDRRATRDVFVREVDAIDAGQ
jgi:hypothetical protein